LVGNIQAPWDVHPSPTLCGRWLKALRGRSGAAGKKPLPTLTKDVDRPSGRASGTCGYPQRRNFESFRFEHARQAADAVFACKGETHAEGRQGRRSAANAVHDQADHRHRRDEAGRDAGRRCRRQVCRHFRLFDKVKCKGRIGIIFGRRSSGSFDVRTLDGARLSAGISSKKLMLLEKRTTFLTQLRKEDGASSPS